MAEIFNLFLYSLKKNVANLSLKSYKLYITATLEFLLTLNLISLLQEARKKIVVLGINVYCCPLKKIRLPKMVLVSV